MEYKIGDFALIHNILSNRGELCRIIEASPEAILVKILTGPNEFCEWYVKSYHLELIKLTPLEKVIWNIK